MIISFGKYKGSDLQDLPEEYLSWLIENKKQDLAVYEAEVLRRERVEAGQMSMVEQIAKTGFRELSKKLHPDTGGSVTEFQALQAGMEQMKMLLKELALARGGK